ncbi:phosphatidylcholine:diacylglycerol cholinephosphotransferase 1-like [Curcuma longa]|uniref:phosphatidylcholine:diacylglycerol cholinephosphotransferase 1-like n=1 Tax=Curcuma longa TaxID=136217 RepID=UPI003D9EA6CF
MVALGATDQFHQPPPKSLVGVRGGTTPKPSPLPILPLHGPFFAGWSVSGVVGSVRHHPLPLVFALLLLVFMGVEYTVPMVASASPPLDMGFVVTKPLHAGLAAAPALNTALAALNTVFVGMQIFYILWTFLVEGRPRPTIAALFMFPCRGILGCCTQLPLPQEFLGSGADFPVGNVSFFLFFSGHVAGAVIASLDMRRARRQKMAWVFDTLNLLQSIRLLASRGHYTIDLAVGVGAGFVADVLAGKYEEIMWKRDRQRPCCSCGCSCSSP